MNNFMTSKKLIRLLYITLFFSNYAYAQQQGSGFYNPTLTECLPQEERDYIISQIKINQKILMNEGKLLPSTNTTVLFDWVLRQRGVNDYSYYSISNYVDLDNTTGLRDYNCGTKTYDGHQGIDIFTFPFWWEKMDNNNVEVIAGAEGVVVYKSDGNFDRRCQLGNNGNWNAVYIQHSDGTTAWYGHLKSGSLTSKAVGQTVARGEYLGIVGSSGYSTGPHLHLEIKSSTNATIDPYNGSCNNIGSRWVNQKNYYDAKLVKLMTHSAAPNPYPSCTANPVDVVNAKTNFVTGETAYFAIYYRDHVSPQVSNHRIIKPDGTIWRQWSQQASNASPFASSYWYWSYTLPSDAGTWKFEVDYNGQTYETVFNVNTTTPCPRNYNLVNDINNATKKYESLDYITSVNKVQQNSNITYDSAKRITLNPGFVVASGSVFKAQIDGCGGN
jgi:murein DD-endopeptidase MepM/ murein hydrolase activator NlpD